MNNNQTVKKQITLKINQFLKNMEINFLKNNQNEIEKRISDDEIRESETFKQIMQLIKEMKESHKKYHIDAETLDYVEKISFSELKKRELTQTTLSYIRLHEDKFFFALK